VAGRADARGDVLDRETDAVDEIALETAVDRAVAGVALGIVASPTVAVDGIVQRLGAVTDVVA